MSTEINWRQNCLTGGPHDGRPEALWNMPLLYAATVVFDKETLKQIVVSRIYNDAMQMVNATREQIGTDVRVKFSQEWADLIKTYAEEYYDRTLQHKVGELSNYYKEERVKRDHRDIASYVAEDKLNPGYEPLHFHDTINLLCRIVGVSAEGKATREVA